MKIHFSPASPFVRKCLVAAHELGVAERIEKMPASAHPVNRNPVIVESNPLGQVPTFFTDDGTVLFDSHVIVEYLNAECGGQLLPASGPARWKMLTEHALADGMLGATLLARYEMAVRPEPLRWTAWTDGQLDKVWAGLRWLEDAAPGFAGRVDIATISFGCVLGYLDFRFGEFDWRDGAPATAAWFAEFSERPSMKATFPSA